MNGKILLLVGGAIGYVIGARQGRAAYDRLAAQAQRIWENPDLQRTVTKAQTFAKEKVPVVGEMVSDAIDNVKPEGGGSGSSGSGSSGSGSTGSAGSAGGSSGSSS